MFTFFRIFILFFLFKKKRKTETISSLLHLFGSMTTYVQENVLDRVRRYTDAYSGYRTLPRCDLIFFFPKTSDVTESRLEQHDKRKLAFQKEVQKAQGPIVGWKTCSLQLVCGLYLVFQEFLFCSSSFHTPVNNLQTKCNVQ